jgi:hypothetical protein
MPELKALGEGEGAWVQVADDGRFPPELVAALEGMKADDEKEGVTVKFSETAAPDALKGKPRHLPGFRPAAPFQHRLLVKAQGFRALRPSVLRRQKQVYRPTMRKLAIRL